MKKKTERVVANIDTELALTNDLLAIAQRLAVYGGWRLASRQLLYVWMRIDMSRGRVALAAFLNEP